ncbi:MAG TPA: hypothetical protein VK465_12940, partial [Fibrobacteria bacterium]|nr:hypothetical protein [Fibrobacteria bacterium]
MPYRQQPEPKSPRRPAFYIRAAGREHGFLDAGLEGRMMGGGILLGGMWSGSGKTTVTLGLLGALKARGVDVRGFKAGPDFIDAGLYSLVTGRPTYNLDPWMCGEAEMRETFARASSGGLAVVEGAMGLFDGVSGGAHLAEALGIPVLLVVDADGMAD